MVVWPVASAEAVDPVAVLAAARKGRSPGQGWPRASYAETSKSSSARSAAWVCA